MLKEMFCSNCCSKYTVNDEDDEEDNFLICPECGSSDIEEIEGGQRFEYTDI